MRDSLYQIFCFSSSIKMKNNHTFPLLPRIKVGIETQDSSEIEAVLNVRQDKYYSKPKMMRIAYSPLADLKSKENNNRMLLQSYVANKRYEDVWDESNQKKIRNQLGPSEEGSRKILQPLSCIGKDATLKYYNEYKILDKTLLKKDFNSSAVLNSNAPNQILAKQLPVLESPSISLLQKADMLKILPLCLGLVKSKGEANILNITNYNLGDRYIIALAAGLRKAKMIQKCYLGANRITDVGLAEIVHSISPQVMVLDFSNNKITKVDKKLLEMIIQPQYRLEQLILASNQLREQSAQAIFRNIRYSRHIKKLNLNNNKLSINCLEALSQMIEKSNTLEQLYIGSNYISSKGGQRIFHLLTNNKILKVLDYSLNQLGEDGDLGCAKAIANCFKLNKTLQHVDISFNNLGKEATQIIAEGLQSNRHIYGLHYLGNYGYVNSRGFIVMQQKQVTLLHSIEQNKIDSFEITTIRQRNAFKSDHYKNVCWICEGWYEQQFKVTLPKTADKLLVYIHFDFERYEPRLISMNDHQVKYLTMVPPKKYRYFFTVNENILIDSTTGQQQLPLTENHSYEMDHIKRQFKVEKVSVRNGKAQKIVNQWNQLVVKTMPRMNGLVTKKQKQPWSFGRSIWAKQWKLEDQELLKKCFERDWKQTKIMNLIKNTTDQDKVKDILWKYYSTIKNIYKQFASWSPFGDIWAVSNQPFTQFCQQSKIINKDTPLKIIDLTFITTNSMSSADWKGNALVPERGLVRFQFMQSLVRLSQQKFKKNGVFDTFHQSITCLLKEHVESLAPLYNANQWRLQKYFNQYNDALIKKYRQIFNYIYKKNSKLKLKPGEKPFMCLAQFKAIIERTGLNANLTQRDIFVSFNTGMMTQIDELEAQRFIKMTQIQFIQGMARCANSLPNSCSIEPQETPTPLHMKFEWLIHQLKTNLCSQDIRAQFPDPQKSMFNQEQEQ